MNAAPSALRELAEELRALLQLETKSDLSIDAWLAEAHRVRIKFGGDNGVLTHLPHLIWHYFSDADIRRRDSGYSESQIARVAKLIEELERGRIPDDKGL